MVCLLTFQILKKVNGQRVLREATRSIRTTPSRSATHNQLSYQARDAPAKKVTNLNNAAIEKKCDPGYQGDGQPDNSLKQVDRESWYIFNLKNQKPAVSLLVAIHPPTLRKRHIDGNYYISTGTNQSSKQ